MQYGAHGSPPFAPAPQLNQRGGCDRHQTFGHTLGHNPVRCAYCATISARKSADLASRSSNMAACPPLSTICPLSSPPTYRGSRLVRTTYKHRFYFSSQCWCVCTGLLCVRVYRASASPGPVYISVVQFCCERSAKTLSRIGDVARRRLVSRNSCVPSRPTDTPLVIHARSQQPRQLQPRQPCEHGGRSFGAQIPRQRDLPARRRPHARRGCRRAAERDLGRGARTPDHAAAAAYGR